MTSRLKHRLELENVNLKSAYLNESFVQVGGGAERVGDGEVGDGGRAAAGEGRGPEDE